MNKTVPLMLVYVHNASDVYGLLRTLVDDFLIHMGVIGKPS